MIPPSAVAHKQSGSEHFASSNFSLALQSYHSALSDLRSKANAQATINTTRNYYYCYPEEERFALACHSNAALCLLRLSQPHRAVEECIEAEALPIFQVAAQNKMREKILAWHAQAMIEWRNKQSTEATTTGTNSEGECPTEKEVWEVLDEARCRGYLEKKTGQGEWDRGASSLEVRGKFLHLAGRLSASSERATSAGNGDSNNDDDSDVRRGFEAWLSHLVEIGKINQKQAKIAKKKACGEGKKKSNIKNPTLQRSLNALDAVLPKPSMSIRDLCRSIIHWIRQGTSDAASRLRDFIRSENVYPSTVDNDGMGHLIWAAAYGLQDCKDQRSEASTDTFLSILDLLVDDLGVSIDQRSPQNDESCSRNPLQWVAKANNPRAVRAMLEKGARVNLRDEEGWTALGATFMSDDNVDDWNELEGQEARDRIETVKILLEAGADVEAVSTTGFTPLMSCCMRPDVESIQILVSYGSNTKYRNGEGLSPLSILEMFFEKRPRLLEDCSRALLLDYDDRALTEDMKVIRFNRFIYDVITPVNDACVKKETSWDYKEDEKQGFRDRAEQELAVLRALMVHVGMDANLLQKRVTAEDGNWLAILYNKIDAMVPKAFLKTYRDVQPTEQELGLMISHAGKSYYEASEMENNTGPRRFNRETALKSMLYMFRERGHVFNMKNFEECVIDAIKHSVGYAVPTDSILERIEFYGPVVEVGAGTGYWSGVLRARGIDTIAYDANPPSIDTMNNGFFSFMYTDIQKGDGTVLFEGQAGRELAQKRTLLIIWPNLNDAEDNPHLPPPPYIPPVWDAQCLSGYINAGGKTVVYVGEREENISVISGARSESGVSSSRRFQNMLKEHFHLVEQHDCPRWFNSEDDVTIWRRK